MIDNAIFEEYIEYLIISRGPTTATGLSELTGGIISHDMVTRMLSTPAGNRLTLWKRVKPLVRHVESREAVLIFDDSIAEKPYTDENPIICWHWDHSAERHVKGINFLTMLYQSNDAALPLAVQLIAKTEEYLDQKTGKHKRRSSVSKNEYLRQLLLYATTLKLLYRWVLADSWYSSAENMVFIHTRLDKRFIFAIKSNRKVALSADEQRQGNYCTVSELEITPEEAQIIYLEGIAFPLVLVKQVFTNEDGSKGVLFLTSDDTTLDGPRLLDIYHKRQSVEVYHKSLKQNASLRSSPTRTPTTQRNHFMASVCAYLKLERLKLASSVNHFALKHRIYINALIGAREEFRRLKQQYALNPGSA